MWGSYPRWCIQSGDFFAFVHDKSVEEAAKQYIFNVMVAKGGTFGEELVIKDDYKGKVVVKFNTVELLTKICIEREHLKDKIKWEILGNRVCFTKTPLRRRSNQETWQKFYWVGERMVHISRGVWIQSAVRVNPFEKIAIMQQRSI